MKTKKRIIIWGIIIIIAITIFLYIRHITEPEAPYKDPCDDYECPEWFHVTKIWKIGGELSSCSCSKNWDENGQWF